MQTQTSMATFGARFTGALRLDPRAYESVEADSSAMGQAFGVVLLSSLASGVGAAGFLSIGGAVLVTVSSVVAWIVWAMLTYLIGTKLLPEPQTRSNVGELLRTTGFATAPGVFRVLAFIPFLGPLLMFVIAVWMLMAMVVAVRHALDYTTLWRALGVVLIGWVIYILIAVVVTLPLAPAS